MSNYYIFRIGQFLARILPEPLAMAMVMFLCDLHFYFSGRDRQAVENNLKIILNTDHVPAQNVRAVFRYFGEYLYEFFTMARRLSPEFIRKRIHINNIEYLNEVLQKGKGGILISAHLGNWEMGGAVLPMLGFPLSVVALAHRDPRVNALFNAQREAFGATVIQADSAVRRVAEHLRKNRLIAILGDRDFGQRGVMADFFGRKTMIPKGAAFFSLKTGAPIIPIFIMRKGRDHFEIDIYPPMDPPNFPGGKVPDDIAVPTIQKYLKIMEDEIRKNPSQWLIFKDLEES